MENITKALFIAAGVLIAIILLTLLAIGYNQISTYYQQQSDTIELKQIIEMSKKFINYDGQTIRGNEMLSVINMVVDYNEWAKQNSNEGYKPIELEVWFEKSGNLNDDWYTRFHYEEEGQDYDYLIKSKNFKINNGNMNNISKRMNDCLSDLQKIVPTATESAVQSLSSNIDTIHRLINKSNRNDEENQKINSLMNNILKINDFGTNTKFNTNNRNKIDIIAHQYYELTYFKRAYFKCEGDNENIGVELYDNGKVKSMTFHVVTENKEVKFN